MIGRIRRVNVRDVWAHQEAAFTAWLASNVDVLNEAIGLSLTGAEARSPAGAGDVDVVVRDSAGQAAVIVCQMEPSDHDHLGKLVAQLAALDAHNAIWVVAEPQEDHIRAIGWLNEKVASVSFYLVQLEAVRIDESAPAPLFTLVTAPDRAAESGLSLPGGPSRAISEERGQEVAVAPEVEPADSEERARKEFWTGLLEHAASQTASHPIITPGCGNSLGAPSGVSPGVDFNYSVDRHDACVELYIDTTGDNAIANLQIFDELLRHKQDIESDFDEPLEWEVMDDRSACRIARTVSLGGWEDQFAWPHVFNALVDRMLRLEIAVRPYLTKTEDVRRTA